MTPDQLDVQELNGRIANELLRNWAWNSAANWDRIRGEAQKENVCASSLVRVPRGSVPAIIIGSGPTLDHGAGFLHDFPGAVFCGCSQAHVLDAYRIIPDYMVAVDTHKMLAVQLEGIEWGASCTLITHQAIDPSVLQTWRGPRKYLRMYLSEGRELIENMYPWLRQPFTAFGCTPNTCLQMAVSLGYSPIYLLGVDFGYPGGKARATNFEHCGYGKYRALPSPLVAEKDWPYWENGVMTTREMTLYRLMFLCLWKRYGVPVVRWGTETSVMNEVRSVEYGQIVSGSEYLPDEKIIDAVTIPFGLYASKEIGVRSAGEFSSERDKAVRTIESIDKESEPWYREDNIWKRRT